jgi:hypothetical protein
MRPDWRSDAQYIGLRVSLMYHDHSDDRMAQSGPHITVANSIHESMIELHCLNMSRHCTLPAVLVQIHLVVSHA